MRALVLVAALVACNARHPAERAVPIPSAAPAFVTDAPSIYELPITLRDAEGRTIGLDNQRGHRVLVAMFYASCGVACPALIDELGRVLDEAPGSDARVLLVSFDAARDTPQRLRDLIAIHRLDARWTLAAAGDADARVLASVLGTRYRKLPSGEFFHTSPIVALDAEGRPIARSGGPGGREGLTAALR
jgi:protein SCO1/2